MKCKRCNEKLINCDGGYGHDFEVGDKIYCRKRRQKYAGNLHYCDSYEIEENKSCGVKTEVIK